MVDSTRVTIAQMDVKQLLDNGPIPVAERRFLINGWRWHTKSVIRDLNRFEKVLIDSDKEIQNNIVSERLNKCFAFVFDFNWKACMKVERELFFPWLQKLLPDSLDYIFVDVYKKHETIKSLTANLARQCKVMTNDRKGYGRALALVQELKECAQFIQSVQESTFIPYIEAYVSKKEQEKFNNRVIARLGLLESQIHIVSMKEAIAGIDAEEELFRQQIPGLARSFIPVWKKRLYSPRASCLDQIS
jgi:hypothetical protein